jgi:hypothetical protein
MRAFALACSFLCFVGCSKKVETPSTTYEAPKSVQGIKTGSDKGGGLPQPPDTLPK